MTTKEAKISPASRIRQSPGLPGACDVGRKIGRSDLAGEGIPQWNSAALMTFHSYGQRDIQRYSMIGRTLAADVNESRSALAEFDLGRGHQSLRKIR